MHCLVTGATGFIGGRLVRVLLDAGHRVRCFVRRGPRAEPLNSLPVELVHGDILDPDRARAAAIGIDWVFHNASVIYHHSPRTLFRTNLGGTLNLLRASAEARVGRFVCSSSVAAMGACRSQPADETQPMRPPGFDTYGRSKRAIELACRRFADGNRLPVTVVRMAGVYGPGSPLFAGGMGLLARGLFVLPGREDHLCAFAHVDDVCSALILAAAKTPARFQTYIVVDDRPVTVGRLVDRVTELLGVKLRLWRVPLDIVHPAVLALEFTCRVLRFSVPVNRSIVEYLMRDHTYSSALIRRELGWAPEFPDPLDGIKTLVDWFRPESRGRS
ncbi:MAG: NAD-dependent epimerase/dehydratase family protein [candidate division WOR-3 bacterium]|nr:MAG: NAD-dependent epimerase/dehydratase family protein [candidate division WOR-3 bacterium]